MSQSSSLRRICVFGAGAIGGALAARLARTAEAAGTQISIVARGLHLAAIRKTGLRLQQSNEGVPLTAHVRATDDPATLGPQDLVFTTVKGHQLAEAASGIGALLGPETRVVTILNGIPWWYFHADPGKHGGKRLPLLDPDGALWDLVGHSASSAASPITAPKSPRPAMCILPAKVVLSWVSRTATYRPTLRRLRRCWSRQAGA
jgi:2-dehydropantoate 2-reductase